jgi:orotate phosphoribosyltransferase
MQMHVLKIHTDSGRSALETAYTRGFIERAERPYIPRGAGSRPAAVPKWALDMRLALADSNVLRPIAVAMNELLTEAEIGQVVGYGYGAFLLVGGIVACGDNISCGLLRSQRKAYGFQRILEGALRRSSPVTIIDDILSSGRSAVESALALRRIGYHVTAVYTVFYFGWRAGREHLARHALDHRCLATLYRATDPAAAELT